MTTITKKQILLSKEVLDGNKLYMNGKGTIREDIEKAITEVYCKEVEEMQHNYDNSYFNIHAVKSELRKMGYRIFGDK